VQAAYRFADAATLRIGVDNAGDKQPPLLYQNNTVNGNTDERTFDTVGRYYWTSLSVDF
jgi:outer membrane receptor protein involved in Fe transport